MKSQEPRSRGRIRFFLVLLSVWIVLFNLHCDREKSTGPGRADHTGAISLQVVVPPIPEDLGGTAKAIITRGMLRVVGEGMMTREMALVVYEMCKVLQALGQDDLDCKTLRELVMDAHRNKGRDDAQ